MEQTLTVKPRQMKGKVAIIIFAVAAILLRGAGYIVDLVNLFFFHRYSSLYHALQSFIAFDMATSTIIETISATFVALVDILPFILLLAYLLFCYRKSKFTVLLPITLGALGLVQLCRFVGNSFDLLYELLSNGTHISRSISSLIYYVSHFLNNAVFGVTFTVVAIACVIILIAALKGFANKALTVVPAIMGIAASGISILSFAVNQFLRIAFVYDNIRDYYWEYDYNYYYDYYESYFNRTAFYEALNKSVVSSALSFFTTATVFLAIIAFFVAIIILASKNNIPEIIPMSDAKLERLIATKPDKARAILKVRYESGKLTEEEYNTRVAEIESKKATL